MDEPSSPGPVVVPARPRVSLRCGPWNAHEECESEFCECPHHGALITRREVPAPRKDNKS